MFGFSCLNGRVKALQRRIRVQDAIIAELCRRSGISRDEVDPYTPDADERRLVADGRTVEAIKHHRVRTGSGLVEAKTAIDTITR